MGVVAVLMAALLGLGFFVAPTVASAAPGDVGVEGLAHPETGTPTGTKRATSVLWFNDGYWWGNLWDTVTDDFHIFRFDPSTQKWVDTKVATETRADTHHDVLWDGTTLYVASYKFVNDGVAPVSGYPSTLRRYSYNPSTDAYASLGSTQINNYRVETLTIDKDTTGRVWATWVQGNKVYLNVTGTDGKTWGSPFQHPDLANSGSLANVSIDDTSALIAFGPGKMGVMWSRQVGDSTDGFYWSVHVDGAANSAWSKPTAVVTGQRSGDDHMNLKWLDSSGGRVFAAVKTSFTSNAQPLIQLLAMTSSDGQWTAHTIAPVSECPNRAIVLIDEATQRLRTFATYPKPSGSTNAGTCTSSGGAIYEKSTPLDNISFSSDKTVRILDADQYAHNVSSTKQNLNNTLSGGRSTAGSGLMIVADVNATKRYWHYHEGGSAPKDTTAPKVTSVSPANTATGVAVGTNVTATFDEAMKASTFTTSTFTLTPQGGTTAVGASVALDGTGKVATLDPTSNLAADTTYNAKVVGGSSGVKDLADNPLASDYTWSFRTAAAGGGTGTTVTLTPIADSYVSSGSTSSNYGTSSVLSVDASPVEITYLKFDLGANAGRAITGATLQLRATSSGSTGTQNVKLVVDDSWTETGITDNNNPALGTAVGKLGPTSSNTNYSVTLTASSLPTDQYLSLGLDSASSDGVDLGSRETTTPPQLVLTFG